MTSELRSLFIGTVILLAAILSSGCGDTVTSSDTSEASFVASTTESSAALGVVDSASSLGAGSQEERRGQGPREEALAACVGSIAGATCSFTGPDGEGHDGTCVERRGDSSQVVCRPDDLDRPGRGNGDRQGPPEESLAACATASLGDACAFEMPFGSISGTCETPRSGEGLACRPSEPRRRPNG